VPCVHAGSAIRDNAGMNRFVRGLLVLFLLPLLVLGAIAAALHWWVGSDDFRARVAQQATAAAGVPIELGRLTVDVWPLPAVAADDVRVRSDPPVTLARIEARPAWAPLLRGKLEITTLLVRDATLPQQAIGAIAAISRKANPPKAAPRAPDAGGADARAVLANLPRRIVLDNVTWVDGKGNRSVVDAQATLDDDALPGTFELAVTDGRFAGSRIDVRREAGHWNVDAALGGGTIKGRLVPKKGSKGEPLLEGALDTSNVEVSALTAPSRTLTGRLQAHTTLRADLRDLGGIADSFRTQTKFTVRNAVVHGLDLAQAVQTIGMNKGGQTRLETLAGNVATTGTNVQLSNLAASSGVLSATGDVAISPAKKLSGRVNVNLASQAIGGTLGVPLVVGGTLDAPSVTLSRGALLGAAVGTAVAPGVGTGAGVKLGDKLGESLKGLFGR